MESYTGEFMYEWPYQGWSMLPKLKGLMSLNPPSKPEPLRWQTSLQTQTEWEEGRKEGREEESNEKRKGTKERWKKKNRKESTKNSEASHFPKKSYTQMPTESESWCTCVTCMYDIHAAK